MEVRVETRQASECVFLNPPETHIEFYEGMVEIRGTGHGGTSQSRIFLWDATAKQLAIEILKRCG
jgi:hypothetical protein